MGAAVFENMATWTMTEALKSLGYWLNLAARRTLLFAQIVGALLLAIFVAMVFETREPPFEILPHAPIAVQAGQWAEVRLQVRRDMTRRCTVSYSRTLIDADGSRFDLPGGNETTSGVMRNHTRTPGVLPLMVLMPPLKEPGRHGIDPGPAVLKVTRAWACNPVQELWPIRADTVTQLYVLP